MENTKTHKLVLYNDDNHDFLYIIACLAHYCKHDIIQAEQCATIAHHKGACSIKSGDFIQMLELNNKFEELDLKTEIKSYESSMY